MSSEKPHRPSASTLTVSAPVAGGDDGPRQRYPVVGIGASAGGLEALRSFFKAMPTDGGMAFVLVQHLDPTHESMMADLLGKYTAMPVLQVDDGMEVQPNKVHVIPPNAALTVRGGVLHLSEPVQRRGMRMPIDQFFISLAEDQQEHAIAMVFSGTGTDGTYGIRMVKASGGLTLAQEPASAQYDGMPRSAIATGDVDYVLDVDAIPDVLLRYAEHVRIHGEAGALERHDKDYLDNILSLILARQGYDFRCYKRGTLNRRILRRMGLNHIVQLADYHRLLRRDPDEVQALAKDLLIGVTGFFRDPDAWDTLAQGPLRELVLRHGRGGTIRVWVPGCATGEEAYGLTMLLLEAGEALGQGISPVIFATDLDKDALEVARAGSYPEGIAADLSTERLRRYFTRNGDKYEVKKFLREIVIFAPQNLITDPPFSNLDLIICRNLLIYIESSQQERLISLFHFALRDGGFLFLGGSETVGQGQNLFSPVSKKWRIYRRIDSARGRALDFPISRERGQGPHLPRPDLGRRREPGLTQLAQRVLLERFAPAAVLIDSHFRVLYFHGAIRDYIGPTTGEPTDDLFGLACDGLRGKLRALLHQASLGDEPVSSGGAKIRRGEGWYSVRVSVYPRVGGGDRQDLLLVTFEDEPKSERAGLTAPPADTDEHAVLRQLEEELGNTREELRGTIEQMEGSNEELKASNEEVMSMNEELQSTNEELETSKEELQSLNEELTTLNSQLEDKVHELEGTNNDLTNLLVSTDIATIFVDRSLRIRRYTPAATRLMSLIPGDLGRVLTDIAWRFTDDALLEEADQVLAGVAIARHEIVSNDGRCYQRRLLPYRTDTGLVEGVVITFTDITDRRTAELAVQHSEQTLRRITDAIPLLVSHVDTGQRYLFNNAAYEAWFGIESSAIRGHHLRDVLGEAAYALVRPHVEAVLAGHPEHFEVELPYHLGGTRYVEVDYVPDLDPSGDVQGFFGLIHDLTERRRAEQALAEREAEFRALFTVSGTGATETDPHTGRFLRVNPKFCAITGYSEEELRRLTCSEITHPEDRETDRRLVQQVFRGDHDVWEVEKRYLRRDGGIVWVWVTGSLIRDAEGRPWRTAAVIQDITTRKGLEQAMQAHTQRLQEINRNKNEFLAMLGHELRNPLTPIVNAAEIMALHLNDERVLKTSIDMLRRQTSHLVRLVDDLLDIGRISNGIIRLEQETVVLQEVISETLAMVGADIEARRHRLEVERPDRPLRVRGDFVRLTQVLANLIGNAVKYTPDGGVIGVRLGREDAVALLSVEDNGRGMTAKTVEHLFQPFVEAAEPEGQPIQGLGMGLYLVERLVELHGGTVGASSPGPGQGSRFEVRLPLLDPATVPQVEVPSPSEARPPRDRGKRVLVVDDNQDIADSLETLISILGHQVRCAHSGEEGLRMASELDPEVILLDIGLPNMDGFEVAAELHRLRPETPPRIIALSGHADQGRDPERAHLFERWLIKPASVEAIGAAIDGPESAQDRPAG